MNYKTEISEKLNELAGVKDVINHPAHKELVELISKLPNTETTLDNLADLGTDEEKQKNIEIALSLLNVKGVVLKKYTNPNIENIKAMVRLFEGTKEEVTIFCSKGKKKVIEEIFNQLNTDAKYGVIDVSENTKRLQPFSFTISGVTVNLISNEKMGDFARFFVEASQKVKQSRK